MNHKKTTLLALAAGLGLAGTAHAQLIITGLGDPDGGTGDILELYATSDISDLSSWGFEKANNSESLAGSPTSFASTSLSAGGFYYVTSDSTDFDMFTGFAADEDLNLGINGNDTIGLYNGTTLVDRVLDDADDTDIHGDGWIYRSDGTGPESNFNIASWTATTGTLGDSNSSTNAASTTPMPLGTYAVPEPSTYALLVGLFSLTLVAFRRRRRA